MAQTHQADKETADSVVLDLSDPTRTRAYLSHIEMDLDDDTDKMELLVRMALHAPFGIDPAAAEKRLESIAHRQTRVDDRISCLLSLARFKATHGDIDVAYKNLMMALNTVEMVHDEIVRADLIFATASAACDMGKPVADSRFFDLLRQKVQGCLSGEALSTAALELSALSQGLDTALGPGASKEWFQWTIRMARDSGGKGSKPGKRPLSGKAQVLVMAREAELEGSVKGMLDAKAEALQMSDAETRDWTMRDLSRIMADHAARDADFPADLMIKEMAGQMASDEARIETLGILAGCLLSMGKINECDDRLTEATAIVAGMDHGLIRAMCAGRLAGALADAASISGSDKYTRKALDAIEACDYPEARAGSYVAVALAEAGFGKPDPKLVAGHLEAAEREARRSLETERSSILARVALAMIECSARLAGK